MGRKSELMDQCNKTHKANVQDVKITYPIDELITCLTDEKALWHVAKYQGHMTLTNDLHWSLNPNMLPDTTENFN